MLYFQPMTGDLRKLHVLENLKCLELIHLAYQHSNLKQEENLLFEDGLKKKVSIMDKQTDQRNVCILSSTNHQSLDLSGQRVMAWMPWVLGMNV